MATVVLAEDTVLGRQVALKRMKTSGDERGVSRFRREALIGASVSHQNLVSIYDVVTLEDGDQVIVMEYVAGETLRDALFRETRLSPVTALRVLEGVSAGLDAIHREGIVHRDVKPANILLGADDTVKLADLGVASIPDRTRITTDGALVGTFSYMAPEQLSGLPATSAADVYALSAVAFEALCGRKAHPEPNPVALAHAISTQPPPDLREVWPGAPAAAAEVLIRGMSKDPEKRPRSASELTGRLRAALDPYTTAPQDLIPNGGPSGQQRDARSRGGAAALGAAAAGAAAAGAAAAGAAADAVDGAVADGATPARASAPAPAPPGAPAPAETSRPAEVSTPENPPAADTPARPRQEDLAARAQPAPAPAPAPRPRRNATSAPRRREDSVARLQPTSSPDRSQTGRAAGAAATPPPTERSPVSTSSPSGPSDPRRRRGLIAAALVPLVVLAVALPVLLSSGGGTKSKTQSNAAARHGSAAGGTRGAGTSSASSSSGGNSSAGSTSTPSATGSSGAAAGASGASSSTASAGGGTPVSAVESFYGLAASHQYSQAWALADPTFQGQLGGYSSFAAGQAGDRKIVFNSARVTNQSSTAATVAVQTTSVRNTGTQHCSGTVDASQIGVERGLDAAPDPHHLPIATAGRFGRAPVPLGSAGRASGRVNPHGVGHAPTPWVGRVTSGHQ